MPLPEVSGLLLGDKSSEQARAAVRRTSATHVQCAQKCTSPDTKAQEQRLHKHDAAINLASQTRTEDVDSAGDVSKAGSLWSGRGECRHHAPICRCVTVNRSPPSRWREGALAKSHRSALSGGAYGVSEVPTPAPVVWIIAPPASRFVRETQRCPTTTHGEGGALHLTQVAPNAWVVVAGGSVPTAIKMKRDVW